jgi:methyltransferase OMS1
MGLCSTPSPHELLENMARHLNTSNPEAKILLLEHGRSYQHWLNNILDNAAAKHAEIHGCWFNRDIGALVEEAAERSGLDVVKERRRHLGTTWIYELRPKSVGEKPIPPEEPAVNADSKHDAASEAEGGYGWRGLFGWK